MSEEARPGAPSLLVVGTIIRPHGLRGAVIVEPDTDNPDRFARGERMLVEELPGRYREVTVESCLPQRHRLLVRLEGVLDREGAEVLRGRHILIRAENAARLEDGEYWIYDLEGMTVEDEEGLELGVVDAVMSGPAQDLLVVKDGLGREFQVPFVEEFIRKVDAASSTVTVSLIDGMGPTG